VIAIEGDPVSSEINTNFKPIKVIDVGGQARATIYGAHVPLSE